MREKVRLKSTKSGFCYYTTKNKRNMPGKMSKRKYDPIVREMCEFKEVKLK